MNRENSEKTEQERLEQLERRVEYLETIIREQHTSDSRDSFHTSGSQRKSTAPSGESDHFFARFSIPVILKENWLYWLGVGMLLLGVVFLFNYSVERGWLIPPVRSVFGLIIGGGLFWLGYSRHPGGAIRQFLMGAGIGAFYITGFATFQLYSFLSYPVAFCYMLAITVLSFGMSVRQNSATLALIGTLGGLATPFMLYDDGESLLLLMVYSCIIMTGAAAIYQFKHWGSLLWSQFIGGGLILLIGLFTRVSDVSDPLFFDRWILQSGLIYMLGLIWLLPLVKELRTGPGQSRGIFQPGISDDDKRRDKENQHIRALTLLIPVLAVQYSQGIWGLPEITLGILALAASVLTASIGLPLQRAGFRELTSAHLFSALVLFTQAMFLFFDGNMLLVVIILEAVALRYAATYYSGRILSFGSHLLVITAWLLMWLESVFLPQTGTPVMNMPALSELLVLISTGLIIPVFLDNSKTAGFYKLAAHIGILGWLAKEFSPIDYGQVITSIAWAVYSVSILIAGFWLRKTKLQSVGMITILIIVGKLFFVDLSQASGLVRIPLFMGFGALFLFIGYLLQTFWSKQEDSVS